MTFPPLIGEKTTIGGAGLRCRAQVAYALVKIIRARGKAMGAGVRSTSADGRLALLVVLVGALAILLGSLAGTAAAKKKKPTPVKTTIAITSTGAEKFTGTVSSPKKACDAGRSVTLYRQQGDGRVNLGAPVEGFDVDGLTRSGPTGIWEIDASAVFLEGDYMAVVDKRIIGYEGHRYKCLAATSPLTHA
jgi:hypothetical protein